MGMGLWLRGRGIVLRCWGCCCGSEEGSAVMLCNVVHCCSTGSQLWLWTSHQVKACGCTFISIAICLNVVIQTLLSWESLYCKLLHFECQAARLLVNLFHRSISIVPQHNSCLFVFVFSWLQTMSFFIFYFIFLLNPCWLCGILTSHDFVFSHLKIYIRHLRYSLYFTGTNSICQWSANRYQTSWALSAVSTI